MPDALTDHQAAGFGLPYLTAWHALCTIGQVASGEKVLIQATGDGVDLAAAAIATMMGARVYTTAPEESVDIVLNSLPGEAIRTGIRLLAPGGRFIQLGRIDASVDLGALAPARRSRWWTSA